MNRRLTSSRSSLGHKLLLWLMMLCLPVQGMSAVLMQVKGPAHAHEAHATPGSTEMTFVDTRRDVTILGTADDSAVLEHSHASGERHHHAADDATVRISGDDLASNLAADNGEPAVAAAMAFLPLPVSHDLWRACPAAHPLVPSSQWAPSNRHPERLDRPPRAASLT